MKKKPVKTVSEKDALLKIYSIVFQTNEFDNEAEEIYEQMLQVKNSKTLEEAMDAIRWWDCWKETHSPQNLSLRQKVKMLRRKMGIQE